MDVAVFNHRFQRGQRPVAPPEDLFSRGGTSRNQREHVGQNNTAANNGDFEVRISRITIAGNNGTVDFGNAVSVGHR